MSISWLQYVTNWRKFVTITEFNKLEQRVRKIENNLNIQSQPIINDSFDSDKEEEKNVKISFHLYFELDLFTNHVW